jgi:hypothetical protein
MDWKEDRMPSEITPLGRDTEYWRSIDDRGALRFRMRHDGGAIVCIVPRAVLLALPGVLPSSNEEDIFRAFEPHLARFERLANAKYAEGTVTGDEIVLDGSA